MTCEPWIYGGMVGGAICYLIGMIVGFWIEGKLK